MDLGRLPRRHPAAAAQSSADGPGPVVSELSASTAPSAREDRAGADAGALLDQLGDGDRRSDPLESAVPVLIGPIAGAPLLISWKIAAVDLARTSWITLVVVCLIAAVLLALDGYTGYAITVVAVGLAGAVNLT